MAAKSVLIGMLRILPICLALAAGSGAAQEQVAADWPTTAHRQSVVYTGPGETYAPAGILHPGVLVHIVERNRIGNWLHIQGVRLDGSLFLDGWVLSGFLNLPESLRYSEVPINAELADADPTTVDSQSMAQLYEVPIIPQISPAMREVYLRGQELGNHSNVITKIGDSVTANPLYLMPMSQDDYVLGPYDYLEETVQFFGPSLAVESVASRGGMTTYVIFDPMWADKDRCEPNESPLECEFRLKRPSVALVMFGPNDVRHMTHEEFDVQMRQLVDETLANGIIPVLNTFSVHPDDGLWHQALNFNLMLAGIARDYHLPLINLWAAARPLPNYGLDIDNVHMTNSGFTYLKYDSGHETWYGVSLLNLLSIRTLDELRRTLEMG